MPALNGNSIRARTFRRCFAGIGLFFLVSWLFLAAQPYFEAIRSANETPRIAQGLALVDSSKWSIEDWPRRALPLGPDIARAPSSGRIYPNKPPGTTIVAWPWLAAWRAVYGEDLTLAQAFFAFRWATALFPIVLGIAFACYCVRREKYLCLSITSLVFATPLASYSKLAYGHSLSALMLTAGVAAIVCGEGSPRPRSWIWTLIGALILGTCASIEYVTVLFVGPWLSFLGGRAIHRRAWARLVAAVVGGSLGIFPLLLYHQEVYGSPWSTGYHSMLARDLAEKHAQGWLGLIGPNADSIWHTFFNPACGLVFWLPWIFIAFRGWWLARGDEAGKEWRLAGCSIAITALVVVSSLDFQGGWRVGPRYLVSMMPLLGAGLYAFLHRERSASWRFFALLLLTFAAIQNVLAAGLWPHFDVAHIAWPVGEVLLPLLKNGYRPLGLAHDWPTWLWVLAIVVLPLGVLFALMGWAERKRLGIAKAVAAMLCGALLHCALFLLVPPHADAKRNLRYVVGVFEEQDQPSKPIGFLRDRK
jgi:hypothetical protein